MALDWLPTYPDRGSRLPLRTTLPWVWTPGGLVPIPNPAPPTPFNSLVYYVDRERPRSPNPTAGMTFVEPVMNPGLMAAYLPKVVFPDKTPRRPLVRADSFVYPWGTAEGNAARMGWAPLYPASVSRFRETAVGASLWIVDGTILLDRACLNWDDVATINPTFSPEATVNPTMRADAVQQPTFSHEVMCDGVLNLTLTGLPNFLAGPPLSWAPLYIEQRRRSVSRAAHAPSFFKRETP